MRRTAPGWRPARTTAAAGGRRALVDDRPDHPLRLAGRRCASRRWSLACSTSRSSTLSAVSTLALDLGASGRRRPEVVQQVARRRAHRARAARGGRAAPASRRAPGRARRSAQRRSTDRTAAPARRPPRRTPGGRPCPARLKTSRASASRAAASASSPRTLASLARCSVTVLCSVTRWLASLACVTSSRIRTAGVALVALEVHLDPRQPGEDPPRLVAARGRAGPPIATALDARSSARAELAGRGRDVRREPRMANLVGHRVADRVGERRARGSPRPRRGRRPGCRRAPWPRAGAATDRVVAAFRRRPPSPRRGGGSPPAAGPGAGGARSTRPRSGRGARRRRRDGPARRAPATAAHRRRPDSEIRPIRNSTTQVGSRLDERRTELVQPQPQRPARHVGAVGHAHRSTDRRVEDLPGPLDVADRHGVLQRSGDVSAGPRGPATPGRGPPRAWRSPSDPSRARRKAPNRWW